MEDARALLNSLMGDDRNAAAGQRRNRKFSDDDVCKKFLLGLCPHDMFPNTKMDLGPCSKQHNEHLKEAFEADSENAHYRRKWRGALRTQLKQLLEGVDRRIELNKARIARERESGARAMDAVEKLKEEVSEQLRKAEKAADEGKFEESRAIMKEQESTKRRIEDLETKNQDKYEKELICCDVCGHIVSGEELEAIQKTGRGSHTGGKQHMGFKQIREKLKEIEDERASDKQNGVRSPSRSPVYSSARTQKLERMERERKEDKRRKSPSRKPERRNRSNDRRRTSRSRRRTSRSKRRARSSRSRRRSDGKKRSSPSPRRIKDAKEKDAKEKDAREKDAKEKDAKEKDTKEKDVKDKDTKSKKRKRSASRKRSTSASSKQSKSKKQRKEADKKRKKGKKCSSSSSRSPSQHSSKREKTSREKSQRHSTSPKQKEKKASDRPAEALPQLPPPPPPLAVAEQSAPADDSMSAEARQVAAAKLGFGVRFNLFAKS